MFSNKELRSMIVTLFFEQLLVMLVGIVDTFVVSSCGEAAVSGVSLVNQFNTIFIYLFTALASGGAIVVSQYIGNKDKKRTILSSSQLLMFSIVFSIILSILVLIFNKQLLGLLFGKVESDVMNACVTYLRISAYSYPALAIYNVEIQNSGKRDKRGGQPYIVTTPRFFAPAGRYEWLNYGAYVGALSGSVKDGVGGVDIVIYRML